MIRITRETDYALLILAHLHRRSGGGVYSARDVSSWAGVSLPMASKILKALARSGLLVSNRGAKGGYGLARELESISVADVVRAIEGPISLVECVSNPGNCDQESTCLTSQSWKRINDAVEGALQGVSVSELVGNGAPEAAPALLTLGDAPVEPSSP